MLTDLFSQEWVGAGVSLLLAMQLPATAILLARLLPGAWRQPPLAPRSASPDMLGMVSVVVPTLNEAARIQPCLDGLSRQGYELREIIVVDSHSQDGTIDRVKAIQQRDPRFRLVLDDPLPAGWVGRPWALHTGLLHSADGSEWVLGIDADTVPQPGLVASLIATAEAESYDLVSLAPQFILKTAGEWWLQPALLMTLLYRFGAAGSAVGGAERVMANGQCFLCRRSHLLALGGYTSARHSFCDDVTLARYAAQQGSRVGFLDGSRLLHVRMYEGVAETWREWGRSLDLKDASTPAQTWADVGYLLAVQGLPGVAFCLLSTLAAQGYSSLLLSVALGLNGGLILIRLALLWAVMPSYNRTQTRGNWAFWLSPLADLPAVWRIALSSLTTPTQWRGRTYSPRV